MYELGEDAGTTFIAMEFVKGRSLKEYLEQHTRFTTPQLARIMGELAALDYSHRNGVVHRDIKPANVMILEDGTVKVADFGIARIEQSNLTQTGMILGTPSYMSPEQFMGQTVDGRSDLFSAGVILYELLTGEKPFSGSATTIMHKVLQEDPLPSTLNVQVPRPFDGVVKRAGEAARRAVPDCARVRRGDQGGGRGRQAGRDRRDGCRHRDDDEARGAGANRHQDRSDPVHDPHRAPAGGACAGGPGRQAGPVAGWRSRSSAASPPSVSPLQPG